MAIRHAWRAHGQTNTNNQSKKASSSGAITIHSTGFKYFQRKPILTKHNLKTS